MANEYATLAEFHDHLNIADAITTWDTELSSKLTAASRRVDKDTGRRFYLDSAVSARVYEITHPTKLIVDDFSTATGLIVQTGDGVTWSTVTSTYYRLKPENNLAESKAVWLIERTRGSWPVGALAQVTAKWGWPAVPDEIKAATLLAAARLYRRKDSPEGTKGLSDLGQVFISRYDPDYDWNISNYIRPEV